MINILSPISLASDLYKIIFRILCSSLRVLKLFTCLKGNFCVRTDHVRVLITNVCVEVYFLICNNFLIGPCISSRICDH